MENHLNDSMCNHVLGMDQVVKKWPELNEAKRNETHELTHKRCIHLQE